MNLDHLGAVEGHEWGGTAEPVKWQNGESRRRTPHKARSLWRREFHIGTYLKVIAGLISSKPRALKCERSEPRVPFTMRLTIDVTGYY
jgi:hypothetical protein